MTRTKDKDIRPHVISYIKKNWPDAYIAEELNTGTMYNTSMNRADVVAILSDRMIAFEIKSASDVVADRCERQMIRFSQYFDEVYFVGDGHDEEGRLPIVDQIYRKMYDIGVLHCGLLSFKNGELKMVRRCIDRLDYNPRLKASWLWVTELRQLLTKLNIVTKAKAKEAGRSELELIVADYVNPKDLARYTCQQTIRKRQGSSAIAYEEKNPRTSTTLI